MSHASPDPLYDQMEQRLADWSIARPDIRAVIVIGSRSRQDHPADYWSDLDCIVFVDAVQAYQQLSQWKTELESALQLEVWFAAYNLHNTGDPEWELVFTGGRKLDLLFTPNRSAKGQQADLADMLPSFPYQGVFERGMRVLVEKSPSRGSQNAPLPTTGAAPASPSAPASQSAPTSQSAPMPTQFEFENRIANYLLELTRAVKLSRRGELWRAARALNYELQESLLVLLEWQVRAQHGSGYDTWRYGRFMEEWIDPQATARLPATYTDNTLPGIQRAVRAALDLLGWIGPQIASRLQLRYPAEIVQKSGAWLRETLSIQEE